MKTANFLSNVLRELPYVVLAWQLTVVSHPLASCLNF